MTLKELFNNGISFEEFLHNNKDEDNSQKSKKIYDSIEFDDNTINRIKSIDKRVNILAVAEIWCPDCIINVPVLGKMADINSNLHISLVKREGNTDILQKYGEEGKVKIPTFILLNENFNEIGYFVERPSIVKDIYKKSNQVEVILTTKKYRNGEYVAETAKEILSILDNNEE